jgi:hypothetical protein
MRAQSPLFKSPMLRTSPEKQISLREIRDSPFLNDQMVEMVRPRCASPFRDGARCPGHN